MLFLQVSNTTGVPFSVRAIAQKEFSFYTYKKLLLAKANTDLQGTLYGDVWRGCCAPIHLVLFVLAFAVFATI